MLLVQLAVHTVVECCHVSIVLPFMAGPLLWSQQQHMSLACAIFGLQLMIAHHISKLLFFSSPSGIAPAFEMPAASAGLHISGERWSYRLCNLHAPGTCSCCAAPQPERPASSIWLAGDSAMC